MVTESNTASNSLNDLHENRFILDTHDHSSEHTQCNGFIAYRANGYSMPKGWITSMNAYNAIVENHAWIEIGVQSPTGDASDHFNYTMPCITYDQAKNIVARWYLTVEIMMDEYEAEKKKNVLYS